MIEIEPHKEGCVVPLRVQAGARRAGLVGVHNAALKVAVSQPAEKGKANQAVVELVAKALGLRRSQLELVAGQTSPNKRLLVRGLDENEVRRRLSCRGIGG
jgi:uncharacterized protein (TIGR00251 family)